MLVSRVTGKPPFLITLRSVILKIKTLLLQIFPYRLILLAREAKLVTVNRFSYLYYVEIVVRANGSFTGTEKQPQKGEL